MAEIEEDSVDPESNVEVVATSSSVQPPDAAISSSVPPPEKVDKSTNTGLSVQKRFLFLIVHHLNHVIFRFIMIGHTSQVQSPQHFIGLVRNLRTFLLLQPIIHQSLLTIRFFLQGQPPLLLP